MTLHINYKNIISKKNIPNLILFTDEKFNIESLKQYFLKNEFFYISDLLKKSDLKKELLFFQISSKKTIFLVPIKKNLKTSDAEALGAKFHSFINYDNGNDYFLNSDTVNSKVENFVGHFLHGIKLKSYEFNIYKTKIKNKFQ